MPVESERRRLSRVLIVEDDDAQRTTLASLLRQEGLEALCCATAGEALDCARREDFGVAVVDLRLPDADGTQLLGQIRDLNGSVRAIIHTAYGSFDAAKDSVNKGAFAFVEKAGDPEILLQHVRRAIREQMGLYTDDLERIVARQTASLRRSEERFRSIAENMPGLVFFLDVHPDGWRSMNYVGTGWESLIGRSAADDIGDDAERLVQLIHPEDRTGLEVDGRVAFVSEEAVEYRLLTRHGGYAWFRSIGRPIGLEDGVTRWHGVLIDVTQRRHAEDQRRRLEDQLRQSHKMEAIGQLAGGVAHDFNNLLTVILGNVELLQESLASMPSARDKLEPAIGQVAQAAGRAAALTSQLLALSRRDEANVQSLNLNHILLNMEDMLRRLLGERVSLRLTAASNLDCILADSGQIERVIMNLVVNARDAMPNGGTLTLETANISPGPECIAVSNGLVSRPCVMLSVADTGVGMDAETLEHAFEPFFTTKPKGQGTGLGLSTTHRIVRQFGGHIDIESRPGDGTRFDVYWPAADRAEDDARESDEGVTLGGSETILVCEDEDLVRQVTCRMLSSRGYTVLSASSGEEALRIADDNDGKIDLVLSDVVMPGMNGLALVSELRRSFPEIRATFVSGHLAQEVVSRGLPLKEPDVLKKPFKRAELLRWVRDALDSR